MTQIFCTSCGCIRRPMKRACVQAGMAAILSSYVRIALCALGLYFGGYANVARYAKGTEHIKGLIIQAFVFDGLLFFAGMTMVIGVRLGRKGRYLLLPFAVFVPIYNILELGTGIYVYIWAASNHIFLDPVIRYFFVGYAAVHVVKSTLFVVFMMMALRRFEYLQKKIRRASTGKHNRHSSRKPMLPERRGKEHPKTVSGAVDIQGSAELLTRFLEDSERHTPHVNHNIDHVYSNIEPTRY